MIEIEDIKKVKLDKDEVLIVKIDPYNSTTMSYNFLQRKLKEIFPNNKFIVVSKDVDFSIIKFSDIQGENKDGEL